MTQRRFGLRDSLARRLVGTTRHDHEALIEEHREALDALAQTRARFDELAATHHQTHGVAESFLQNPFLAWRPPGHYYSAIPDLEDLRRRGMAVGAAIDVDLPGVDLRADAQLALFAELEPLIDVDLVTDGGDGGFRYRQPNGAFDLFDAAVCSAMIRRLEPTTVIEVGSGYSSALLADLAERHLPGLALTCIEPYPELLQSLLRPGDRLSVIDDPVQDVDLAAFEALGDGDVLFIDSTHVVKAGSDVVDLFSRVVPSLRPGVVVHVHDIFHPFEYPWDWVAEGRAWSEAYLLRAFLSAGSDFEILFFNNWFGRAHADRIAEPRIAAAAQWGGSIWLRRRSS